MTKLKITALAGLLTILPFVAICQTEVTRTPAWFKKPPRPESGKVIGVGKGWSVRMNLAEQKAIMSANESIARQITPPVKTKRSFFGLKQKGTQTATQQTTLESETVKASISNSVIINKAFKKHKDGYLFYIMIEADFQ